MRTRIHLATVAVVAAALVLVGACKSGDNTTSLSAATTTTVPLTAKQRVARAYEESWAVWVVSVKTPAKADDNLLTGSFTAEALDATRAFVSDLVAKQQSVTGTYRASVRSVSIDGDTAVVLDCGAESLTQTDANGAPIESSTDKRTSYRAQMRRVDDKWLRAALVVDPAACATTEPSQAAS